MGLSWKLPSFVDLFAGIGGFRLGLERAGWDCAWSNDLDRWACAVYRKNFGEILEADVRSVDPTEIPDADTLVAGFPCQPFSYAGKRTGFRDPRGALFFEVARILKVRRFPLVLLENVKGFSTVERKSLIL